MTTEEAHQKATRKAQRKCFDFLSLCREFGWAKSDLDWLENLWWKYHDEHGNLVTEQRT